MSIPEHIIEEIKSRTSISEIAAEFVQLRRSGQNQVALCPFHSEKSPSFHVREEQASFHCFGCGKHGTVFTLLMELRGMTFPEAVRYLGAKLGIEMPDETKSDRRDDAEKKRRALARAICSSATEVYRESLARLPSAGKYLDGRRMSAATLEKFQVGAAPDSWEFIAKSLWEKLPEFVRAGTAEQEMLKLTEELGLIKRRDGSEADFFDVFRNRIIFPIARSDGASIAFGGRIIPPNANTRAPKYLNSCESLLYQKRQTLYGLPQAMRTLRSKKHGFVVEGYMDVLGLHQAGVENVVATCGTAASDQHAALLRRFVERVTIVFDGDPAGRKAAAQVFEVFLNSGLDCYVVSPPEGEDPDTLAQKLSTEELHQYLDQKKQPLFELYLENLIQEFTGGEALSPATSGKVATRLSQLFGKVKNSVEREFLMRRSAEELGVTVSSLEHLIREEALSGRKIVRASNVDRVRQNPPPEMPNQSPASTSSRPASRRSTPAAADSKRRVLKAYYQQLLIAVVSEPSLSTELLSLTAFSEGGLELPKKLVSFLEAVQKKSTGGEGGEWDRPFDGGVTEEDLRLLLNEYGFPAEAVMLEVKQQMSSRGFSAQAVVRTVPEVGSRHSLKTEIENLKAKQSQEGDAEYALKIAQEKLQKRRTLDRLNRP